MRVLPSVALLLLSAGLAGCSGGGDGDASQDQPPGFCEVYAEHRDDQADQAAAGAEALAAVPVPDFLTGAASDGLAVWLDYLRDAGDGQDEGLFEDQYQVLLAEPAGQEALAFLDASDTGCDLGATGAATADATADATVGDYCAPLLDSDADTFGGSLVDAATGMAATGTPPSLGRDGGLGPWARRGYEIAVDRLARASADQVAVVDRGEDDAFRQAFGVTDAPYLEAWLLATYQLCEPEALD